MDQNLFNDLRKIDVGITRPPVKDWMERYSKETTPGTFRIEETKVGPKLVFTTPNGNTCIGWPRKIDDGRVAGIPYEAYIREAIIEYFADPKAFMKKVNENPGTDSYKKVWEISFTKDGKTETTRIMAFDAAEAKQTIKREKGVTSVGVPREITKESKTNECDVPGTMKTQEDPDINAEDSGLEDYSDTDDPEKLKDKTKETDLALREVPDKELEQKPPDTKESKVNEDETGKAQAFSDALEYILKGRSEKSTIEHLVKNYGMTDEEAKQTYARAKQKMNKEMSDHGLGSPNESKRAIRESLRFCDACGKTFRANEAKCKCGNEKTEVLGEREYSGMNTGMKTVWLVQYTLDGKEAETRVMAYDEADAKRQVEKMKRGSKAVSAKKIASESKVNEARGSYAAFRKRGEAAKSRDQGLSAKGGKKPEDFDKEQLDAGTKVEMEHTDDPAKAQQIAMDHLTEDPKYYTKLNRMESGQCESKVNDKLTEIKSEDDIEDMIDFALVSLVDTVVEEVGMDRDDAREAVSKVLKKMVGEDYIPEGKVPDDADPEDKKIGKLIEGVLDVVDKTANLTDEDKQIIRSAVESGMIEAEFPSDEEMIDELSQQEDFVDPDTIDSNTDTRTAWLKYVATMKAIDATTRESKTVNESQQRRDRDSVVNVLADKGVEPVGDYEFTVPIDGDVDIVCKTLGDRKLYKNESRIVEKEASGRLEILLDKAGRSIKSLTDYEFDEIIRLLRAEERGEKHPKKKRGVNEQFPDKVMPGQKPETPEEKKKREALVSAAAKAAEGMGDDELEAYAQQIKKRQQGRNNGRPA